MQLSHILNEVVDLRKQATAEHEQGKSWFLKYDKLSFSKHCINVDRFVGRNNFHPARRSEFTGVVGHFWYYYGRCYT